MKILAIDTSCDDTSVAILEDLKVIGNCFWSKLKLHAKFGGVVPSEAKRQHEEFLDPVIAEVLNESNLNLNDIDILAVTYGPGLAIALESGIKKAKDLANKFNKPLIAVNHMAGHIYASLARDKNDLPLSGLSNFEFPLIGLTISGGHTELVLMTNHLEFKIIGETVDDAAGEAIDKIGRVLGMGFPAGNKIEDSANKGDVKFYSFPRPMLHSNDLNFSFSGLKTAALYEVKKITGEYTNKQEKGKIKLNDSAAELSSEQINNISASFCEAVFDCLIAKCERAILEYNPKMLIIGGGVIANLSLREKLKRLAKRQNVRLFYPFPLWLCTDNASMIGVAAYYYAKVGRNIYNISDFDKLDRVPSLRL